MVHTHFTCCYWWQNMTLCVCVCVCVCSGWVCELSPDCLMKTTESFLSRSSPTLTCPHRSGRTQVSNDTNTHTYIRTYSAHVTNCPSCVCCCVSEPLGGVVEGLSAGMFLIGMMVAVVSLLVYRQRLRKVWVHKNTHIHTYILYGPSSQPNPELKTRSYRNSVRE